MTAAMTTARVSKEPAGSDLAMRDRDSLWQEVHRVTASALLSRSSFYYRTACYRTFVVSERAYPLKSGAVKGAKCHGCWPVESSVGAA